MNIQHTKYITKVIYQKVEDIHDIESGKWLSDNHMHAAQQLLKKQFPNRSGLQDTLKPQNLSWELMIPGQVQLLRDDGFHWICVSTRHYQGLR